MREVIDVDGYWSNIVAEDVMTPIDDKEIIDGNLTVKEMSKDFGPFSKRFYIVALTNFTHGIFDIEEFSKELNYT